MTGWLIDDTQTIFHEARDSFSIVVNFDQSGFRSNGKMRGEMKTAACAMAVDAYCPKEIIMLDSLIKRRADAHFSTLPGVEVGKTIMTESEAVAAAVAANSARLKELRLARDAAQQAAPAIPVKKAGKKNSKQNGKKNRPAASLSDWLKNRQAAGHSH
jgi:hypothetical protein